MAEQDRVWTVIDALEWTIGYLGRKGDDHPRRSAEWLMSAATDLSRVEIYTQFDRPLSMPERDRLREAVKRRAAGEPLQYVTGEVAFRHLVLKVRRGVLIPRPETEVTVECGLEMLDSITREREIDIRGFHVGHQCLVELEEGGVGDPQDLPAPEPSDYPLQVLDLCTGSGCIALSIAQENPAAFVTAIDISAEAVSLARDNAAAVRLGHRLRVLEGDLYAPLRSEAAGESTAFDLVISNPPYVPTEVVAGLAPEVRDHEPGLALDGGADGLDVFRRILVDAAAHLRESGSLVVELHETCLDAAAELARASFSKVQVRPDLTGRPRILVCWR